MQSSDPKSIDPVSTFHTDHYLRLNQRRQEHLASLGLKLDGVRVLEVGAGIGDHTSFFLDRGCSVVITEGRPENLEILRTRFLGQEVKYLDLDSPTGFSDQSFEIIYCYGLLYHLKQPSEALDFLAERCQGLLLLETCVSFFNHGDINPCEEAAIYPSQAISGVGCRPTRQWIFYKLRGLFPHVYITATQPWHEEFPLDWDGEPPKSLYNLTRSVFVASRTALANPTLLDYIPTHQTRH